MSSFEDVSALIKRGLDPEKIAARYGITVKNVLEIKNIIDKEAELKTYKNKIKIKKPKTTDLIVEAIKDITKEKQGAVFTADEISKIVVGVKSYTIFDYLSPSTKHRYALYIRAKIPYYHVKDGNKIIFYYGKEPSAEQVKPEGEDVVRTTKSDGGTALKDSDDELVILKKLLNEQYMIEEHLKDLIKWQKRTYELFEKLSAVKSTADTIKKVG